MSKFITATINLDKIDKSKIKEFKRGDGSTGKSLDIVLFINPEDDKYGNNVSIAMSKEKGSTESTVYIGNGKDRSTPSGSPATGDSGQSDSPADDLPF
jgi:hypothetical protein